MGKEIKSFAPKNPFLSVIEKDGIIKIVINAKSMELKDNCDTFVYVKEEADIVIDIDEMKCDNVCPISKAFGNFAKTYSI